MKDRDKLILNNLRLAGWFAKKYERDSSYEFDDLYQVAIIGLIKAVDTFDESKGVTLGTYAFNVISNEMNLHLRRNRKHIGIASLDSPCMKAGNERGDEHSTLGDLVADEYDLEADIIVRTCTDSIRHIMCELCDDKEKFILCHMYGVFGHNKLTQKEIGEIIGVKQSQVSRLNKQILKKIKKGLSKGM